MCVCVGGGGIMDLGVATCNSYMVFKKKIAIHGLQQDTNWRVQKLDWPPSISHMKRKGTVLKKIS